MFLLRNKVTEKLKGDIKMRTKICIGCTVVLFLVLMCISTQQIHDTAGAETGEGVPTELVYVSNEMELSNGGFLRFYTVFQSVDGESVVTIEDKSLWLYMNNNKPTSPIKVNVVDTGVSSLIKMGNKLYNTCRIYEIDPLYSEDLGIETVE